MGLVIISAGCAGSECNTEIADVAVVAAVVSDSDFDCGANGSDLTGRAPQVQVHAWATFAGCGSSTGGGSDNKGTSSSGRKEASAVVDEEVNEEVASRDNGNSFGAID